MKNIFKRIATRFARFLGRSSSRENHSEVSLPNQELLTQFIKDLQQSSVTQSTVKNYQSDISQFIEFTGETYFDDTFTESNLRAFLVNQEEKGLKPSSIQRKVTSIKIFIHWVEKGVTFL